ncbi:MAG TPA: TonB-dependent receptor plug domain-containing protein [Methylosinus sp.]|jgi:iron complex outermembrane receptor protein|uniref:TonB-dependent receptor n=1 Tax=Methylosinus sp. TaxID=427 RepID=UPI002F95B944
MARGRFSLEVEGMGATAIATVMGLMALEPGQPAAAHVSMTQQEISSAVRAYQIPEGSVAEALTRLADENGVRMIYRTRLTKNFRTAGLIGSYTLTQALDTLLSGTGVSYRVTGEGRRAAIILAQADNGVRNDATPSGATPLPAINIGAEAKETSGRAGASSGAIRQGPGDRYTGYNVVSAPSTLKTDTPLLKTPISVQVVTREMMDDQQAISLKDALLTNVSGVTLTPNFFDVFKVRGFLTFGSIYKNGLQEYRYRYLDTTNLQSVEVLKGPAAMLFGRMEPGGVINLVAKRPLETPYTNPH